MRLRGSQRGPRTLGYFENYQRNVLIPESSSSRERALTKHPRGARCPTGHPCDGPLEVWQVARRYKSHARTRVRSRQLLENGLRKVTSKNHF
ncbi:unnamed protein product [Lampetra fluviatilis]